MSIQRRPKENLPPSANLKGSAITAISSVEKIIVIFPRRNDTGLSGIAELYGPKTTSENDFWDWREALGFRIEAGCKIEAYEFWFFCVFSLGFWSWAWLDVVGIEFCVFWVWVWGIILGLDNWEFLVLGIINYIMGLGE